MCAHVSMRYDTIECTQVWVITASSALEHAPGTGHMFWAT